MLWIWPLDTCIYAWMQARHRNEYMHADIYQLCNPNCFKSIVTEISM